MSSFYGNSGVDKNTLSQIAENTNNIGNLSELNTTAKDNLVAAINQAAVEATAVQEAIAAAETATEAANTAENAVNNITQNLVQISENTGGITEIKNYLDMKINTKQISGSIINFSDGLEGYPFKKLEIEFEPIQDLHGQSNPYPGGGGKNLFDKDLMSNVDSSIRNVTLTLKPNTNYTMSTTLPKEGALTNIFFHLNNASPSSGINGVSIENSKTLTTGNDGIVVISYRIGGNTKEQYLSYNYQIEEGTEATAYAPYSNICPISGRQSVTVGRSGVNVWDEEWELGYYNHQGDAAPSNTNIRSKNPISVVPNTEYFLKTSGVIIYICQYDASGRFIAEAGRQYATDAVFVTNVNARFIKFNLTTEYGTTYNHDISINYPSTDHDYHPSTVASVEVQLGQTIYGGKMNLTTGEMTADTISVELTGDELWSNWTDSDRDSLGCYTNAQVWIDKMKMPVPTEGGGMFSYCHIDNVYNTDNWWAARFLFTSGSFNRFEMRIPKNVLATPDLTGAKAYLNEHPLQACYKIAPFTIQLSSQQLTTLKGVNNVWSNGDNINATYVNNIESRLDNKQGASEIICNASGSVASFADGADGYTVKNLTVNIQPMQDLHGQSAPYPAGGGVNKLPPTTAEAKTEGGLTCTSDGNGRFTFTGTYSSAFNQTFTDISITYVVQSGDYLHCLNSVASSSALLILNFTDSTNIAVTLSTVNKIQSLSDHVGKTVKSVRFYVASAFSATISPMILNTDTATAWSPYSNICPISGRTEAGVWRTGKNLLNEFEIGKSANNNTGGISTDSTNRNAICEVVVDFAANNTYVLSGVENFQTGVFAYDANRAFIGRTAISASATKTFTAQSFNAMTTDVTNPIKYVIIKAFNSDASVMATINNKQIQFEVGSTATAYEPYNDQTLTIPLAQTVYGGTVDVTTGEMVVDRYGFAFDGTTNPWANGATEDAYGLVSAYSYINVGDLSHLPPASTTNRYMLSNWAIVQSTSPDQTAERLIRSNTGTQYVRIYLKADRFTGEDLSTNAKVKAAVNAWAQSNPVQIVYYLAVPVTVQLVGQSLTTLKGVNNIWSDADSVTVDYVADTKLFIEQLTEPDADMIADANIVNGKYFMVGNNLYKATVNIAKDAAIVPGMNCTKTNLAAALNEINS